MTKKKPSRRIRPHVPPPGTFSQSSGSISWEVFISSPTRPFRGESSTKPRDTSSRSPPGNVCPVPRLGARVRRDVSGPRDRVTFGPESSPRHQAERIDGPKARAGLLYFSRSARPGGVGFEVISRYIPITRSVISRRPGSRGRRGTGIANPVFIMTYATARRADPANRVATSRGSSGGAREDADLGGNLFARPMSVIH